MSEHPPSRLLVPVAQSHQAELLLIAAEAALLDRAQDVSHANLHRLQQVLGNEAARPQAGGAGQGAAGDAQEPSQAGSAGRRLHVLVVEDRQEVLESWWQLLGLWGQAVTTANDGPQAIAAALVFPPDVVLMDIGLPTIDGYETARRIRRVTGGPGPRFVALTGRGRCEDKARSQREGFACHLQKPVEPCELRDALARIASESPTALSAK